MNNITLREIASRIRETERMIILTHDRPDGDTIGSAYAIKNAFPDREIYVINDCVLSGRLAFVAGGDSDLSPDRIAPDFCPDLVMAVDIASLELAGKCGERYANRIDIRIDHHAMGQDFAQYNYTDPHSASCGEIIFDLLRELDAVNARTAAPLYAAICSDTGSFRYSSVTADTYRKAAALVETGIDFSGIAARMVACKTAQEVRAIRAGYELLRFHRNGQIASILFTSQKKSELNLAEEDLCVLASLPKEIDGVQLSIVIKQCSDDVSRFKISMRSEPSIAANALCALFGGGGHLCAGGATVTAATPEEAEQTVLSRVFAKLDGDL